MSIPQSNCYGDCLARWPFFYNKEITAQPYLNSDDFTVFTKMDGNKQTAYRGVPLYYYSGDLSPGDTNGIGIEETWYLMRP